MLAKRLTFAIVSVPIGIGIIAVGGWPFTLLAMAILGVAGWEYGNIFRKVGFQPATWLLIGGPAALALMRALPGLQDGFEVVLSGLVLAAMAHHLVSYEKGREPAATDFAITLAGIVYLGVLGSYIAPLRLMPEGKWWTLLVLPPIWLADAGAYFVGTRLGRHPMTRRLSPKKTWEGYFGGVLTGAVSSMLLAALWSLMSPPVLPWRGAVLGLIIAVVSPLGDLGKSMIKRQAGVKDSSNILPGHGGVLDRIDTWLWGGVIGYYLITWFWQT